jgi:hypothetical protein
MKKIMTTTIVSDDAKSYMVLANALDIIGLDGVYIVYAEGNNRELYKLYKHYVDIFGDHIYFMTSKGINFLEQHSQLLGGEYHGVYYVTKHPKGIK